MSKGKKSDWLDGRRHTLPVGGGYEVAGHSGQSD
jgi:hypothetical protein